MTKMDFLQYEKDLREYEAGDIIFEEGSEGDVMYAVLEGEIDLLCRDVLIDSLSRGDIFGEMAIINHATRSATARAKTAAKVAVINHERFLWLVQETPMFAVQVMGVMADRLRKRDQEDFGA